jgi:hypothetical protein
MLKSEPDNDADPDNAKMVCPPKAIRSRKLTPRHHVHRARFAAEQLFDLRGIGRRVSPLLVTEESIRLPVRRIARDRYASGICCFWTRKYMDNREIGDAKLCLEDRLALTQGFIAQDTSSWNGIDCMRKRRYFG